MNQIRHELKEKDMDIVQLQKEIDELQLENKMLKLKMPLLVDAQQLVFNLPKDEQLKTEMKHPFVSKALIRILYFFCLLTFLHNFCTLC